MAATSRGARRHTAREMEPSAEEAHADFAAALEKATGREIVRAHIDRVWNQGDVGEQELVMQFFHLLHARKYSLNPDDIETRRQDFEEQMKVVFDV
jgi:hypothetical protein